MAVRVAVLDDYQGVALASADWSVLGDRAVPTVFRDHLADEDEVAARLAPFEVVVAMRERTPFPASLLGKLPGLRLLITTGMHNAAIDFAAAAGQGVTVCGTAGRPLATPELTWGLLLAVARGIPQEDASVRAGGWQHGGWARRAGGREQHSVGVELNGRTLGLLGLGSIGQRMARYAHAFDMEVLAWSPNLRAEDAAAHGVRRVEKDELFRDSDVVSLHVRLGDRSRGVVGAAELALLGPDGYLVNTSRGPLVDEAALVEALRTGTVAGAALDVYDTEPLPADHPLRGLPNVVLSPHQGFVSQETYALYYGDAVEDIDAWLRGEPVREL